MASLCKDGTICVWSIPPSTASDNSHLQVQCLLEIQTNTSNIIALSWSTTSDKYLVTAGKEKAASIWSATSGQNLLKLEKHTDCIYQALFAPSDDTKVFTIGSD